MMRVASAPKLCLFFIFFNKHNITSSPARLIPELNFFSSIKSKQSKTSFYFENKMRNEIPFNE